MEGEYTFDGPREEVWKLVRDPQALSSALPGAQSLNQVSDSEYQGEMNLRIGPVAGVFSGRIVVSDEAPPQSCTLTVEGKGKTGFVNGTGHVQLFDRDGDRTLMKYSGEVQIGGKLASVGQRLFDTVSKSVINQGLQALNQVLKTRLAAQNTGQEVEYKPLSETEFAASVAKGMVKQVFRNIRPDPKNG